MSKTVWIVERTDRAGEWQPVPGTSRNNRDEAVEIVEQAKKGGLTTVRYRVVAYIRKVGDA